MKQFPRCLIASSIILNTQHFLTFFFLIGFNVLKTPKIEINTKGIKYNVRPHEMYIAFQLLSVISNLSLNQHFKNGYEYAFKVLYLG